MQRATVRAMEAARVTLSGDLSGDYMVEERRPDGRVVLRPDLSVKAMLSHHGECELTQPSSTSASGTCQQTARAEEHRA